MTQTKFTPGPWFVCGDPGFESQTESWREGLTIGSAAHGTRVCDVTTLRVDHQAKADARLIAAAPEMYEALKYARLIATTREAAAIFDAALSKAEG